MEFKKISSCYNPRTIAGFVKYLTPDPEPTAEEKIDSEEAPCEIRTEHICTKNHTQPLSLRLLFNGAIFQCLHPGYDVPFCGLSIERLEFFLENFVDHQEIAFYFGRASLLDLTNYPDTIFPLTYRIDGSERSMITPKKTLVITPSENLPTIHLFSFERECPKAPQIVINTNSALKVNIEKIKTNFVSELLVLRQIPYISNCIGSYFKKPPEKKVIKKKDFTMIDITVNKISLSMKPKFDSAIGFTLFANDLRVENGKKEESLWFGIIVNKILVLHGKKPIIDPFDFNLSIESPINNEIDPIKAALSTKASLRAAINLEQIDLFIQCFYLNLNFTDGLKKYFSFSELMPGKNKEEHKQNMELTITAPSITIMAQYWLDQWFLKAKISNIMLHSKILHTNSKLKILAHNLCILDWDEYKEKSLISYHKDSIDRDTLDTRIIYPFNI